MTRCSDESAPTNGNLNMHASEPTNWIKKANYWQEELVQNYVELARLTSKRSRMGATTRKRFLQSKPDSFFTTVVFPAPILDQPQAPTGSSSQLLICLNHA
jgi:hypothetical protein